MRFLGRLTIPLIIALMGIPFVGCAPEKKPIDPDARKRELEEIQKNRKKEWGY